MAKPNRDQVPSRAARKANTERALQQAAKERAEAAYQRGYKRATSMMANRKGFQDGVAQAAREMGINLQSQPASAARPTSKSAPSRSTAKPKPAAKAKPAPKPRSTSKPKSGKAPRR